MADSRTVPETTHAGRVAVATAVRRHLIELRQLSREELLAQRYEKYRSMGAFLERQEARRKEKEQQSG